MKMSMIPEDLLYAKDHIWVRREGSDIRIGITDHGQSEFGSIVVIEFGEVGDSVVRDDACASVGADKNVAESYAARSGTIVEVNEVLANKPPLANKSPHQRAALIVMEAED